MSQLARLALTAAALALLVTVARAQPLYTVYLPAVIQPPTATTAVPSPSPETPSPSPETPSPEPSTTPTLPPPDFVSCAIVGDPGRAPNYPVAIVGINKQAETVTLRNVSAAAVDLSGWRMCSVTGGQSHPIGGTLAPGAEQVFPGPAANIWNNNSSDPGTLWNASGQLVSYWPD